MRTCVVTGATSGIGLAVASGLASAGEQVLMVGRDSGRLNAVAGAVRGKSNSPNVLEVQGDLGSIAGVRATAEQLAALPRIDVLIHCAGVWPSRKTLTADGFEEAFMVNHLAPFLLNERLVPLLRSHGSAWIVQVSAGLAFKGRVDLERDPSGESFHAIRTYAATKLWNLLATLELARTLHGSGVTINAIHPGVVRTKLGDMRGLPGLLLRTVKRFWLSPEQGARGPLYLALSPEVAAVHGAIFNQLASMELMAPANDAQLARQVVEKTRSLLERHGQASA